MNIKTLLSTAFIVSGLFATAQTTDKAFAITGDGMGDFMWMNIRQIDLNTGKTVQNIFDRNSTSYVLMDADTKQPVSAKGTYQEKPTESMVAAAAYDGNQNKLFFTPMRIGELRWLDLNAKGSEQKYYTLKSTLLNNNESLNDEANHFTRMVIAADGNGYAVTNDANRLIRFTTGKKVVITDMGNIIDDENNKNISIHNKCSSWGGDMIADAYNKLYIISANHHVFKVDVDTRVATYIGAITGLPANYTTNGAAVDKNGDIIVASANVFVGYYKLKLDDLVAQKIEGSDATYNSSDLANSNLLLQKEADAARTFGSADFKGVVPVINTDPHIYPNPVTNYTFNVLFDGVATGRYNITITDLTGKPVMHLISNVTAKGQVEPIKLNKNLAKGMYMVKVTDSDNKFIFTERIVVQ